MGNKYIDIERVTLPNQTHDICDIVSKSYKFWRKKCSI